MIHCDVEREWFGLKKEWNGDDDKEMRGTRTQWNGNDEGKSGISTWIFKMGPAFMILLLRRNVAVLCCLPCETRILTFFSFRHHFLTVPFYLNFTFFYIFFVEFSIQKVCLHYICQHCYKKIKYRLHIGI